MLVVNLRRWDYQHCCVSVVRAVLLCIVRYAHIGPRTSRRRGPCLPACIILLLGVVEFDSYRKFQLSITFPSYIPCCRFPCRATRASRPARAFPQRNSRGGRPRCITVGECSGLLHTRIVRGCASSRGAVCRCHCCPCSCLSRKRLGGRRFRAGDSGARSWPLCARTTSLRGSTSVMVLARSMATSAAAPVATPSVRRWSTS